MISSESVIKRIADALLVDYTSVYYVDAKTNEYYWYSVDPDFCSLKIEPKGDDFFVNIVRDAKQVVYEEDLHIFLNDLTKEKILKELKEGQMRRIEYRLMIDGRPVYHALRVIHIAQDDGSGDDYFILGVMNIDEEYRQRDEHHTEELNRAREMARRDPLTGIKNKTAYHETEMTIQKEIENGICDDFAIVVCDINDLKIINDTKGHKAGDEYIRSVSRMICNVFTHSPVFRVGGDEFAVILKGADYNDRDELMTNIRNRVLENINIGEGCIVATGMSEYRRSEDHIISEVFNRADELMYENKKDLKEQKIIKDAYASKNDDIMLVPENRRRKLDSMFKAFATVAEGNYVFLCDMKYDYSRWSKTAVDTFGLPSEYMYHAGDLWEERIHPEDRGIYHIGIGDIFAGNASGHDMQYRARKVTGEYDVCTCKGFVLTDSGGKPEYFCGAIRNHGVQGNIDSLTGLRNSYGFFDDIRVSISNSEEIRICMIGLSRFSEINEIYGYQFGNRVLQKLSRALFEKVGNNGVLYRLDGTKYAIITRTFDLWQMMVEYEKFRNYCRAEFYVDDKCIPLELNCGAIHVDSFDIDYQTIYACLNFAYDESKRNRKGDMVDFDNSLNEENRQRIEVLHSIRASISHGYEGFYLLYQPVVDAHSEKLIAAEALLRWKNDEFGVMPPDYFIPLLEIDAQFPNLGLWIIRQAVSDAKTILENNPDFMIHVNLSYTQIEKPDFVEQVEAVLEEQKFPARNLCLEITERCRLLDIDLLKNVITKLRGMGIYVALDDFGTGFSAIGLLKSLSFDIIKIDRSFVTKIEEVKFDRDLIEHFTRFASTFNASVCVEGVETVGMRDILRDYPVESFQGYLYAKPLDIESFQDKYKG